MLIPPPILVGEPYTTGMCSSGSSTEHKLMTCEQDMLCQVRGESV